MQGEPEPEPASSAQQAQGIDALFTGFPCELVRDALVGGNRAVVASRRMDAGEQVLTSAALGFALDRRHMATRCAWCFATREVNDEATDGSDDEDEDGLAWQLRCERCCSAYYCSEACQAAATPQHHLECAALRAIERRKQLKKERLMKTVVDSESVERTVMNNELDDFFDIQKFKKSQRSRKRLKRLAQAANAPKGGPKTSPRRKGSCQL